MKRLTYLPLFLIILAFPFCTTTEDTPDPDPQQQTSIDLGPEISRTVTGLVLDENDNPVANADVHLLDATVQTDEHGSFTFYNSKLNEKHAFVTVEKSGYFKGSRSFYPTNGVNTVKITLLEKNKVGQIDASNGGTISFEGVDLDLPGGIQTANGSTYSGNVNVYAKYLDPEDEEVLDQMPGNLRGEGTDGESLLATYGMIAVELEDNSGNLLQLADGESAEVRMPIPPGMQSSAPATIPLWHFDEKSGFWKEDGEAKKVGSEYIASVSHFSFWNIDIKVPWTKCFGKLIDDDGSPVSGIRVTIKSPNAGTRCGYTGSDGGFGGMIPSGVVLNICFEGGLIEDNKICFDVGPFSDGDSLGSFTIQDLLVDVTGSLLDCDGNKAPGYVVINNRATIESKTGDFSFKAVKNSIINVRVVSADGNYHGEELTVNTGTTTTDLGALAFCKENQGVWIDDVIGMRVGYTIFGQGDSNYISMVDLSAYEDLDNGILRLKIGKANGYPSDEYLTLDLMGTYTGVGQYVLKPNGNKDINFFTGRTSTTQLIDYEITLSIASINLAKGGYNLLYFEGSFVEYNPSTGQNETKYVNGGEIYFKLF